MMKADYLKFVRWNQEDSCFVGYCPDLFIGGVCHGKNEKMVYADLCKIVAEDIKERKRLKKSLPPLEAMVTMPIAV
ncbi:hypothetical protein QPK87_25910 [Kamptonema cortianum]|nr:hypothetical protein [Oscillatoria laete-virens]MDK3159971.1 hypothetical protein [Kamptonema cortianum]MDL5047188.1 hypothetical protein [Oscillatoria amoena NRMC-F 0135]MDL5055480.1 hypothetical protein [Oscillatoria laete-virens NRMC-F 0139]